MTDKIVREDVVSTISGERHRSNLWGHATVTPQYAYEHALPLTPEALAHFPKLSGALQKQSPIQVLGHHKHETRYFVRKRASAQARARMHCRVHMYARV